MCYSLCNTQSSAPEDGWDQRPKHVEMIGIINKQLLLQLVGVYIIYVNGARLNKFQVFEGALKFFVSGILPRYNVEVKKCSE